MPEDKFSYEEIGAFLMAIGTVMMENGLCAGAAHDGNSYAEIMSILKHNGVDEGRLNAVAALPLDYAISYINI